MDQDYKSRVEIICRKFGKEDLLNQDHSYKVMSRPEFGRASVGPT